MFVIASIYDILYVSFMYIWILHAWSQFRLSYPGTRGFTSTSIDSGYIYACNQKSVQWIRAPIQWLWSKHILVLHTKYCEEPFHVVGHLCRFCNVTTNTHYPEGQNCLQIEKWIESPLKTDRKCAGRPETFSCLTVAPIYHFLCAESTKVVQTRRK